MTEDPRGQRYRYVIGGLASWAHLSVGLNFQSLSPLLPLITEDYSISSSAGGLLLALALLLFALFSLPGGMLTPGLGVRRVYTLSWLMVGLSTLSFLAPNFGSLLAIRIIFGLGMALIMPATGPLIMGWFRPNEALMLTSLNVAALSLGIALSTSTAAPLAGHLGWEGALGVFGAVALAGAIAWMVWGKVGVVASGSSDRFSWRDVSETLRKRAVLMPGIGDAACFAQYVALTSWLPTFYSQSRDISLAQAGLITSALPLAGVAAVLFAGFLAVRVTSRRMFFIVPGIMAAVGGLGTVLVDNTAIALVCISLLGIGSWLYVPMLFVLPMELEGMTPGKVAVAWGWIMAVSGMGGFVAPLAVGILRDMTGSFIPGFLVFAVLAWMLVVAGLSVPEPRSAPEPSSRG